MDNNCKEIKALKCLENIGIRWTGNVTHDSLDKCLTAINLNSNNSGWYQPKTLKIKGLKGYYMLNEDGSLLFESRIIKQDDKKYVIEHLTKDGFNEFEKLYRELEGEH